MSKKYRVRGGKLNKYGENCRRVEKHAAAEEKWNKYGESCRRVEKHAAAKEKLNEDGESCRRVEKHAAADQGKGDKSLGEKVTGDWRESQTFGVSKGKE